MLETVLSLYHIIIHQEKLVSIHTGTITNIDDARYLVLHANHPQQQKRFHLHTQPLLHKGKALCG
jgi:hypothetical protein